MVHRYADFINFQASVHNMILEPKKDPTKQVHNAWFMITNADVDVIIKEWLDEWHGPLAEPLPAEQHQEDPSVNQGNSQENGQGNDEGDGQYNQS